MTAATATLSATSRPLALRARGDLRTQQLTFGGRPYWGIKDPVSLRYYQLRDEEFFILSRLDGRSSLQDIRTAFERRFAPQRITASRIQAFLGLLHEQGLILADRPGQGEQLLLRRDVLRRHRLLGAFGNLLAIRFRGFDPENLLGRLYPICRWMFSPWAVGACVLMIVSAMLLCAVQFDVLASRLPGLRSFFSPSNLFWLAVALAFTKVLHELGHGLACKHFGGECHEMGVMLLAFTPCLYCNVSDAWMLRDKWKRIAIGTAGMYVELVLAAACTFLWWFSQPGLLNALCLNVMFLCSAGTLLFNGNPLLRFDGYYVLADLLEVPNLRQQSRALLHQWAARWFGGLKLRSERMLPDRLRGFLAVYGVASVAYRWFVIVAILWFCYQALKPYRLEALAEMLAAVVVAGLLTVPAIRVVRFLRHPGRSREVKWRRLFLRGGLLFGAAALLLLVRWPYRIAAPAVLEPHGARRVYVSVPGRLIDAVGDRTEVEEGEELGRLQNHRLRLELARLRGERDELKLRLENLLSRQVNDPAAAADIPAARERLADAEQRLRRRLTDEQELTLRAPAAGTVFRPPSITKKPPEGGLPEWSGTPLEDRNRGGFLETGTLFCLVGEPGRMQAVLVIDQADVELVRPGQRVRVVWNHLAPEVMEGTIQEIAKIDLKVTPRELFAHEDLAVRVDERGIPRPTGTAYQARVRLDADNAPLLVGGQGRAKIETAPQSLARRLYRYLARTFHFEM